MSRNPRPPASAAVLSGSSKSRRVCHAAKITPFRNVIFLTVSPPQQRGRRPEGCPRREEEGVRPQPPRERVPLLPHPRGRFLGSALGFAALQGVFRIPGFKFSAWMTILTTFTYFLCGALEMKLTNDSRKASWKNYGILSVYTYGGMAMTNYASPSTRPPCVSSPRRSFQ